MATAPKRTPDPDSPLADEAVAPHIGGEVGANVTTFTHEHPTDQEIAAEAYAIYIAGGRRDGFHLDDWLEAERRLRERRG